MWTLRDLFMMLSPQYAQQWREQQAARYRQPNARNDSQPFTLEDLMRQRSQMFEEYSNRTLPNIWGPQEYNGVSNFYPQPWQKGKLIGTTGQDMT